MSRRIGRWVSLTICVLMIALCVAIAALWIRSYWRGDDITSRGFQIQQAGEPLSRQYLLYAGRGGICLAFRENAGVIHSDRGDWQTNDSPSYPQPWSGTTGITIITSNLLVNSAPPTTTLTVNAGTISNTLSPATNPIPRGNLSLATRGTFSTSAGQITGSFTLNLTKLSLPPPKNPPSGSYQFFAYRAGDPTELYGRATVVIFPFWSVLLLMTLLTIFMLRIELRGRRRRWRAAHGCCIKCGYDLRASPERCPECGAIAVQAS